MTRGGDAAPNDASDRYSTSIDVDTALANITTETEATLANSDSQLEELAQIMNHTRATLQTDTMCQLSDVQVDQSVMNECHLEQVRIIERAARALTVRTLELDNASLSLAQRETRLQVRQREFDTSRVQIMTELRQREDALSAREASLKFSSVELAHLHTWSRALDKRESQLAEMEAREMRRVAMRRDQLARWEQSIERANAQSEAQLRKREDELESREKAITKQEEEIALSRTRMLLQIEKDRAKFWKHVRVLSTEVAEELDTLQRSYRALEDEFESCADFARRSMSRLPATPSRPHTDTPVLSDEDTPRRNSSQLSPSFIEVQPSVADVTNELLAGLSICDTNAEADNQNESVRNTCGTANETAEHATKETEGE